MEIATTKNPVIPSMTFLKTISFPVLKVVSIVVSKVRIETHATIKETYLEAE
jgi:hypothetical protein